MQITRRRALGAAFALTASATLGRRALADPSAASAQAAQALDALAAQDRFAGSVLVAAQGKPVLRRSWGLADRERGVANTPTTRFNIASMGKMFTAVGIGQLVDEGRLDWSDKLSQHLPDFDPRTASRVTIHQLLTHTAGFGAYFASPRWPQAKDRVRTVSDFMALFRGEPLQFEPGARYGYSNNGYVLLGAVIEGLRGRDYYAAMRRHVLGPAGMDATGWPTEAELTSAHARSYTNGCAMRPNCAPEPWKPFWGGKGSPAGGGYSTVDDLFHFEQALRAGKLLKPQTLRTMLEPKVRMDRPGGPQDAYGYGFGRLTVAGRPAWGHNGGTIGAGAQLDSAEDGSLTMVVLTNQDGALRPALAALRKAFA